MTPARRLLLVAPLLLPGCASRGPVVILGPDPDGRIDAAAFLAAHPLPDGEALQAIPVGATETASYAIVQVRTAEPPHVHRRHDLTVLVLRGAGRLHLVRTNAGASRPVTSVVPMRLGDAASIPRGVAHWFVNDGGEPAAALAVFSPPFDGTDHVPVDAP
jgi:quercetin dioxygenase-like cupin family protein